MWRKRTLAHCWWKYKFIYNSWKTQGKFLKKLKVELLYNPGILLLGLYPEK
jgi:hypothetical protein